MITRQMPTKANNSYTPQQYLIEQSTFSNGKPYLTMIASNCEARDKGFFYFILELPSKGPEVARSW